MFSFIPLVFICALASRVLAFNVTVGSQNLTTTQILNVPDSVVKTACTANCTAASSQIQACNDDATCLCRADTVASLLACEQCMFTKLIEVNKPMDFRVGSAAVLSGYANSCNKTAGILLAANQTSLTLPSTWDGPFVAVLPIGGAAITVCTERYLVVALAHLLQKTARGATRHALASSERISSPKRVRKSLKCYHSSDRIFSRHSTYLGIRHFFLSSAPCAKRKVSRIPTYTTEDENEALLSISSTSTRQPRVSTNLTAAENEWLQEEHLETSSVSTADSHDLPKPDRFDWRLRAPSRIRKSLAITTDGERAKYIRRKHPAVELTEPHEPFYGAITSYEDRFLSLLTAEQLEDEKVLQDRLSTWPVARLLDEGYCLTGLSAYWLQANQFGRPVASFLLGPGLSLPENKFENGTQVLVSRIDPLLEEPIKGSVVSRTSSQIRICFAQHFDVDSGEWRVDVGRSNIIFERMRNAISYFHNDPQQLEDEFIGPDQELILRGTHLRDVFLQDFEPSTEPHPHLALQAPDDVAYLPRSSLDHAGQYRAGSSSAGAFQDDMRIQSWARRYAKADPVVVEGDPVLTGLNSSQTRAMATMIGERISLVQGPPGTGKTKTIIETAKLLKVHFEVPHPILVCTYTNVAVDNLVEGLVSSGVKALRVGFGNNIRSSLLEHTLDHKLSMHPLQSTVLELTKKEEDLSANILDLKTRLKEISRMTLSGDMRLVGREKNMKKGLQKLGYERSVLKSKLYAMQQEMLRDVLADADVICTTCITSACVALNVTDFPVVFLDEASMSTEPASLIPIMKGSRHVALIGDHKQLPPVITSREAQAMGLGTSLFERLTKEGVVPSIMLDIQYRMHPKISRFPASEFYDFNLQDGTVDLAGNVQPWLYPPSSRHLQADAQTGHRPSVIFLDHSGVESMKDRSRVNLTEAHIVASVVEDLLLSNPQLQGRDIGIIAPYVAQISLLTRLFNRDGKYRTRFVDVLGHHRAMQLANIEIKTVDGFEGREKEVIIFSTVRNNSGGYIGFLADRRRLNVGLTRAKRGLFVVGNLNTLKGGSQGEQSVTKVNKGVESWRRYAQFLAEQGLVVKLAGDSLGQALYGNLDAARKLARQA